MNLRRFSWLISGLTVVVLLATACAPVTVAPAPAAQEPAAQQPAAQEPAPAAAKRCEGVKIVFFPGGPPG
jgi:ribosomal protein L12E/L44/L45/RPP1/RPP2